MFRLPLRIAEFLMPGCPSGSWVKPWDDSKLYFQSVLRPEASYSLRYELYCIHLPGQIHLGCLHYLPQHYPRYVFQRSVHRLPVQWLYSFTLASVLRPLGPLTFRVSTMSERTTAFQCFGLVHSPRILCVSQREHCSNKSNAFNHILFPLKAWLRIVTALPALGRSVSEQVLAG